MATTKEKVRRNCRVDGCTKIIKSQGVCQAHGARTRKCKMAECTKQAQGNFDGMCKFHFKESRVDLKAPPDCVPEGVSVYETILPESMAFIPQSPENEIMPLVAHLKHGFDTNRPRGWHRNDERRARGLWPVQNSAVQLQGWERELVWMEICILSGNPKASFRHLARAWGRDKGFHTVLTQFICDRRGNVERKQRAKAQAKAPRKMKGKKMEPEHDFFGDILDFEDMELPIETLDAMRGSLGASDTDDESETERDSFESNKKGYADPLDEHLLMVHDGREHGVAENAVIAAHRMETNGGYDQNVVSASQMVHNGHEQEATECTVSVSHMADAAVIHNVVHEQVAMKCGECASSLPAHNGGHEQGAAEYAVSEAHDESGAADYAAKNVMPHDGGHEQQVRVNVVSAAHMMAHSGGHKQEAAENAVSAPHVMTYNGGHEESATKFMSASHVMMPHNGHEQEEVKQNYVLPYHGYEEGATDYAVGASQVLSHNTHEQAANQYPVSASHAMAQNGYEQGATDYFVNASHGMANNSHEQAATEYPVSPSHFMAHDGGHEQGQNIVNTSCVTVHNGGHPHVTPHIGGQERGLTEYAVESAPHAMQDIGHEQGVTPVGATHMMSPNSQEQGVTEYVVGVSHVTNSVVDDSFAQ